MKVLFRPRSAAESHVVTNRALLINIRTEDRNLHDEALTEQLYKIKEQFDSIPPDVFWRSRAATNPYERVGIVTISPM